MAASPDEATAHANGSNSPLKLFRHGKQEIGSIFGRLRKTMEQVSEYLASGVLEESDLIPEQKEVNLFAAQVTGIESVLARDNMKVVFVGHTSNGKSTVINSMLHARALPSGYGHTTNCFCCLQASEPGSGGGDQPYMRVPGSAEKRDLATIKEVAHAMSEEGRKNTQQHQQIIHVHWPVDKCRLLGEDVVMLDSPGMDVSVDHNSWIDNHCRDADVFVLVANGESIIHLSEKNFFHTVNEKLSKPNVFILINKWDHVEESEPEMAAAVRRQHLERAEAFLTQELAVIDRGTVDRRVFFVSAKEALARRVNATTTTGGGGGGGGGRKSRASNGSSCGDGAEARYRDFQGFEHWFEECISRSATRTKFEQHVIRGVHIVCSLEDMLGRVARLTEAQEARCSGFLAARRARLAAMRGSESACVQQCEATIALASSAAQVLVDEAMRRLLTEHLPGVVRAFRSVPFRHHGERGAGADELAEYKAALNAHVEQSLARLLRERCSEELCGHFQAACLDVIAQMDSTLLRPPHTAADTPAATPHSPLDEAAVTDAFAAAAARKEAAMLAAEGEGKDEAAAAAAAAMLSPQSLVLQQMASQNVLSIWGFEYLDCKGLNDGFREDLDFRFTLGFSALGPRLLRRSTYSFLSDFFPTKAAAVEGAKGTAAVASGEMVFSDQVAVALTSPPTYAALTVVASLLTKPTFWKVLAVCGGCYCALYGLERLLYTQGARERRFKRQFLEHAALEVRALSRHTGNATADATRRELGHLLLSMQGKVAVKCGSLEGEIARAEKELSALQAMDKRSKQLRSSVDVGKQALQAYQKKYISQ